MSYRGRYRNSHKGGPVPPISFCTLLFPFFSIPSYLEVAKGPARESWRSAVRSRSRIRGRSPAENEFGAL